MSVASASIVIPTFNQRTEWLSDAVKSAREQTTQVEVIVVDDGSSDPIPGATVRHGVNRGISAALNSGIRAMSTDWFCWLSSDDLVAPDKVAVQLDETKAAGKLCSFHRYYVFGLEPGASVSWVHMNGRHKKQRQALGTGCLINGSTVMIHRSVFEDVGLFDESYRYGQDWEMWARIAQKYEWHFIDKFLGARRQGGNLTARIERDAELRAVRDAEDERIRKQYGVK